MDKLSIGKLFERAKANDTIAKKSYASIIMNVIIALLY